MADKLRADHLLVVPRPVLVCIVASAVYANPCPSIFKPVLKRPFLLRTQCVAGHVVENDDLEALELFAIEDCAVCGGEKPHALLCCHFGEEAISSGDSFIVPPAKRLGKDQDRGRSHERCYFGRNALVMRCGVVWLHSLG